MTEEEIKFWDSVFLVAMGEYVHRAASFEGSKLIGHCQDLADQAVEERRKSRIKLLD